MPPHECDDCSGLNSDSLDSSNLPLSNWTSGLRVRDGKTLMFRSLHSIEYLLLKKGLGRNSSSSLVKWSRLSAFTVSSSNPSKIVGRSCVGGTVPLGLSESLFTIFLGLAP